MFVQVQAFGSVECDPELVVTPVGTAFTEFPLAINTKRCVEDITILLTCQAWGEQAEAIKRSVTKGAMLFVQGHFTPHQYATEDGKQGVDLEVTVIPICVQSENIEVCVAHLNVFALNANWY